MPLFLKHGRSEGVFGLIREIIVLQCKLDNLDEQDFYFQKGQENHRDRLESLKEEYARLLEMINNNGVHFFLEQLAGKENDIRKITSKRGISTHDQIALRALQDQIEEYQNILHIKGKLGGLKPIDEFMSNEYILKEIFS
jgi:hypothetical protein